MQGASERGSRAGPRLVLEVEDDGAGLPSGSPAPGGGLGLANTRARLERLYGGAARLALRSGESGGAVVTVDLPRRAAAYA